MVVGAGLGWGRRLHQPSTFYLSAHAFSVDRGLDWDQVPGYKRETKTEMG